MRLRNNIQSDGGKTHGSTITTRGRTGSSHFQKKIELVYRGDWRIRSENNNGRTPQRNLKNVEAKSIDRTE